MYLLCTNLLILLFAVRVPAQQYCDTSTQYESNGVCCNLCPPGTKMTALGSCLSPDCRECEESHYTDAYTKELECEEQPYCDPNKNFQKVVLHESKKKRTMCQCKVGSHCATESCIVCVPHTVCGPGEGAARKGDHSHDTKCEKCPDGTFSNETSWESECKKWTECESGSYIQQAGTDKSDNICALSRAHIVIVVIVLVIIFGGVAGLLFRCYRKGKSRNFKLIEPLTGEKPELQRNGNLLLSQPTVHTEEELSTFHDALPSQEETRVTPEENDDESGLEISSDIALTDNGNFVTQEDGKKEVLSRQESQTQTFSEHRCEC